MCYHGWPGTDYERLGFPVVSRGRLPGHSSRFLRPSFEFDSSPAHAGHAEAVSISLDAVSGELARKQAGWGWMICHIESFDF